MKCALDMTVACPGRLLRHDTLNKNIVFANFGEAIHRFKVMKAR